jgi:hypothetical protein
MMAMVVSDRSGSPTTFCGYRGTSSLRACLQGGARVEHTRAASMWTTKILVSASALMLLAACTRGSHRAQSQSATSQVAATTSKSSHSASNAPPSELPVPKRLLSLPVSAYSISLALDGDLAYLLTRNAAYRLAVDKPPQKIELDLGIGPVLTDSGFVFWSKGAVWNAGKDGSHPRRLAALPDQPEYFVASKEGLAWLDRGNDGLYKIQSLHGQKPRVLVADQGEISALHMIHEWVYFVLRAKDQSWRIGRVHVASSKLEYTDPKTGPTPALLAGTENPVYYDMGSSEIRQLNPDLKGEQVWLRDFVCSPIHQAKNIYCNRVEGFYEVLADSRKTKLVWYGGRETITSVRANSKQVVWTVDTGPDQLAVNMLPIE